jgi:glycogenin
LNQYERVLYLDADTLVLANLDHLFALPRSIYFATSPELGFPDCFNSGVMLLSPDEGTFSELKALAANAESFDGGDQGLLNMFFGDGTRGHHMKRLLGGSKEMIGDGDASTGADASYGPQEAEESKAGGPARTWFRLSFTYNMEMHKVFRFCIPAVLRYRDEYNVAHFIGKEKPWHFTGGEVPMSVDARPYDKFYAEMVRRWWDVRRTIEVEV